MSVDSCKIGKPIPTIIIDPPPSTDYQSIMDELDRESPSIAAIEAHLRDEINLNAFDDGENLFFYAVCKGHEDVVDLFIQCGADVNLANEKGITPLLLALESGHLNLAKLLIKKGANGHIKNHQGISPLDLAQKLQYAEIVQILEMQPTSQDL